MTTDKVTIDRELLEQVASEFEHDNDRYMLGRELRKLLAVPRQPECESEGLEVVVSQFPEINFSNYGQDEVEALQAWGFTALDAMAEAQRAIAELREEISDLHTTMMAAAVEIQEHWQAHCDEEGYGPANLMHRLERGIASLYGYTAQTLVQIEAERDTLRQQLAEARDEITQHSNDLTLAYMKGGADMRQQRDRLAQILRDLVPGCKWRIMRPRIDAALAEIDNGN